MSPAKGWTALYWRLSSFYFFYFALLGAMLPYWSLYLKGLGFDSREIGMLSAIIIATKIIAPNIWGWLADKTDRRLGIVRLGCIAAFVAFLGIFIHQGFWWLALVLVVYSFFWNAVLAQYEVITLSHLHGRYERYSRIRLWGSIGFIAAVAILGGLFDYVPINLLPVIMTGLLACIALSSFSVFEKKQACRESIPGGLGAVLAKPGVIAFFAVCFLLQVSHGPYYTFFSLFLERHGYSTTITGYLWALGVFAEVVLFLFVHRLLVRFSLRVVMIASLALAGLRWLLIAVFVEQLPVLLFAQCLHAASFGSFHAVAIEMVRRRFGAGFLGQGQAIYSAVSFGAGGATGAFLSGFIWDSNAALCFIMAFVACIVALLIAWRSVRQ
jgi:PPP family 3-phenylpropionic acid transporter